MKPTKYQLEKLQTLMGELGYTVRFEKGNFQSGYCIVENRKMAIINKFFDTEARINSILQILEDVNVNMDLLSEKSIALYKSLLKEELLSLATAEEEE